MKFLRWLVFNAAFFAALWFGFVEHVDPAKNVALFWIWVSFGAALFMTTDAAIEVLVEGGGLSSPLWLDFPLDVLVLAILIWAGAWWASVACLVVLLQSLSARELIAKRMAA